MTVNERIKILRKDLKFNQKEFADKLGMSQTAISWSEKDGNNVPDSTLKAICTLFNVNEDWLRNGNGAIYANTNEFDLDAYVKSKGASEIELQILKAYFELDPDVRDKVMEAFKKTLNKSDS